MPQRQLICAAARCGKTQQLASAAHQAIRSGVAADQILALTVHRPAAAVLRDTLERATDQPIPTTTVRQRALAILRAVPEQVRLPAGWDETALLSGIDRRVLINEAWSAVGTNQGSLFAQRGSNPGALDWVARLFDRFSDWCGTADPHHLPQLDPTDAELAELWRAYTIYLQLCQQFGVIAFSEVLNRAADALRDPTIRRAYARRVLMLDDLELFQPAELLFVGTLLTPATDLYAASTYAPTFDSPIDRDRFVARWLAEQQMQTTHLNPPATSPPPPPTISAYASPDDEAHAIAHQLRAAVADGAPVDECAIIAFDPELVPVVQRVLPQYGLPVDGEAARDGYTLAIAPLAHAGLKLIGATPLSSAETIDLLRHPALGLGIADAHCLVEAVVQARLQPFAATEQRWPDALSAAGRAKLGAIHAVTTQVQAQPTPPSQQIQTWLGLLGIDQRAWQQTAAALEPWAVDVDQRHWARLLTIMQQAEHLRTQLGVPLAAAEAAELWPSAQALIVPEGRPWERAVHVWQPDNLGGCVARTVCVAGVHEGALPQPQPALPFDDQALTEAFGALPGFAAPQAFGRAANWQRGLHDLRRARSRAGAAVHLSWSRTDRQGRRRLPSPLLAPSINQIDASARTNVDNNSAMHSVPSLLPPLLTLQPPLDVPPPPDQTPFYTSPTAIEDYFTCPRRCFYARQLRLYDVASSPRQALGQVVHDALHDLLSTRQPATIDANDVAQVVARHWINDEHRWGSRLKRSVFRQLAEQAVAQVARYEADRSDTTFVGGELTFTWTLPDSDIVLSGRIDRIDRTNEGLRVIDYKLGQTSPSIATLLREFVPPEGADADAWRPGDIQLPVYTLAIEQGALGSTTAAHERVHSVALMYPLELYSATGKASSKGVREIMVVDHQAAGCACETPPPKSPRVGTMCRKQLAAVEHYVRDAVAQMRAHHWPAAPRDGSQTCNGCPFRPICSGPQ